jgi:Uncharacterised protein family (UPF0236)
MSAAVLPLHPSDSTCAQPTVNFATAHFAFRQLHTWLTSDEANGLSEAAVEEQVDHRGREVLRLLLQAHLAQRGTGEVGPALRVLPPDPDGDSASADDRALPAPPADAVRHGEKRLHERTLHTTLGEVTVARTAYVAAGQRSIHPLDEQLQLPERSFSYPLQERLLRHAVQGPFAEAVANVAQATEVKVSKRSAEQVLQEAAVDFAAFYEQQAGSDPDTTGPIVVTGIDGKGVPMLKPEQALRKVRRGKGDKKHKKRMATVATVRTQQPRVRTPEEVVESLFRTAPKEKKPRRRPGTAGPAEHKRVWAGLRQSKDEVIAEVAQEVRRVDPQRSKTHVVVCDGERALQRRIVPALLGVVPSVLLVLDLMHVLSRLWQAAHCFYPEGSSEATAWVRQQCLRILQGRVSQVVKGIRQSATKRGLRGKRRETIDQLTGYLYRNREHMQYDVYLRQGLPIASGCVEGACKHLIKDRMERSGMRWTLEGAEAMIRLRSLYLSGDFDEYWEFHLEQDQQRLYPPGRWQVVEE